MVAGGFALTMTAATSTGRVVTLHGPCHSTMPPSAHASSANLLPRSRPCSSHAYCRVIRDWWSVGAGIAITLLLVAVFIAPMCIRNRKQCRCCRRCCSPPVVVFDASDGFCVRMLQQLLQKKEQAEKLARDTTVTTVTTTTTTTVTNSTDDNGNQYMDTMDVPDIIVEDEPGAALNTEQKQKIAFDPHSGLVRTKSCLQRTDVDVLAYVDVSSVNTKSPLSRNTIAPEHTWAFDVEPIGCLLFMSWP